MNRKLWKNKYKYGFVALMSVIIISIILLLMATTLSRSGFLGRLNILNSEYKEKSFALAEACMDTALLKLAIDATYAGGPPEVNIGANKCTINPITSDSTYFYIETTAVFQNAVTNLRVKVSKSNFLIISFEEVPNF